MQRRNMIALAVFFVFYISFGMLLALFQERVVYHPDTQNFGDCAALESAEQVTYKGTRMYVERKNAPFVVFYHGNAGSACDRSIYADIFRAAGYGYAIVEYTGYSGDTEKPSHVFVKRDVQNVVDYIKENSISKVIVAGESVGTGAASYHASLQPPDMLLLVSPFTSLLDVAKRRFWFYPTSILVDNAFDNVALLQRYKNMTTVIHGDKDAIIAYKLGRALFESLQGQKEFVTIAGAGHNDLFVYSEMYIAIEDFLARMPH